MNLAALLLSLSLAVAPCGPPNYSCLYTGIDAQPTGAAPFTAGQSANTIVQLADLSKGKMVQVTDDTMSAAMCVNGQWSATQSGGDTDVTTNTTGTMLLVTCAGDAKVFGFNPATLQVTNLVQIYTSPKTLNHCGGTPSWSKVYPNVLYCRPILGSALYAMTFAFAADNLCGTGVGTCPDPTQLATQALLFDFANCPKASTGTVISGSILGVGSTDSIFTTNLSWMGGQNSARYQFAYIPGVGCSTLDTQGDGTTPQAYYADGSQHATINAATGAPLKATWLVHDSRSNDSVVGIGVSGCVGVDCGVTDSDELWQPNTNLVYMTSEVANSGGHGTLTRDYKINVGNPSINRSLIAEMSAPARVYQLPYGKSCCQSNHLNGDIRNDVNPLIGASGGQFSGSVVGPFNSEVYLIALDGSQAWRCCHTYSSNTSAAGFEGQYAIGAPNQPRTVYCFTSDMLGNLGKASTGNKAHVYCAGLAGQ